MTSCEPEDTAAPPFCADHREVEHSDHKVAWCDECGWRWEKILRLPALKVGRSREERRALWL